MSSSLIFSCFVSELTNLEPLDERAFERVSWSLNSSTRSSQAGLSFYSENIEKLALLVAYKMLRLEC